MRLEILSFILGKSFKLKTIGNKNLLDVPGDDYLDQIKRTIAVLGTPTQEDMTFIGNDLARKYIRKLPKRNKQSW